MPHRCAQNPVFTVDPATLAACQPKVICPNCGTVLGLAQKSKHERQRCPVCNTTLTTSDEIREIREPRREKIQ